MDTPLKTTQKKMPRHSFLRLPLINFLTQRRHARNARKTLSFCNLHSAICHLQFSRPASGFSLTPFSLFSSSFRHLPSAILLSAFLFTASSARAINVDFSNAAGGTWATGGNWVGGTAPTLAGDTANLTADLAGAARTVTIGAALSLGTLNIGEATGADSYTVARTAGTLTMNNSGAGAAINMLAGSIDQTFTYNSSIVVNDAAGLAITNNSVAGKLIFSGGSSYITTAGGVVAANITVGGAGDLDFLGLTGFGTKGTFEKVGAGTLTVAANSPSTIIRTRTILTGGTYKVTGGVRTAAFGQKPDAYVADQIKLNGGTLKISTLSLNLSDVNSGVTFSAASTLDVDPGLTLTFQSIIAGAGKITKKGTGTVSLGANVVNSFSGGLQLDAGTWSSIGSYTNQLGADLAANKVTFNGGSLLIGKNTSQTFQNNIDVLANGTLTATRAAAGAGSSTHTYSGVTTLSGGATLSVDLGGALVTSGLQNVTFSNVTIGAGNGGISSSLGAGGATSGTLTITALNGAGNTATITSGTGVATSIGTVNDAGTALVVDNASASSVTGVIGTGAGTLTKSGAGTLTLSGNNTYTGLTTVSAGTLKIGAAERIADTSALSVSNGATFDLGGFSETVGSLTGGATGTVTSSGAGAVTLTVGGDGTSTAYAGAIQNGSGTVSLVKTGAGTQTLSGSSSYTGTTTVNGGTLSIGADSGLGTAPGGATAASITLNNGTLATTEDMTLNANRGITLGAGHGTVSVTGGKTLTYNGIIAGVGNNLTKTGAGTLTLGGANSYTGTTTVSVGTLKSGAGGFIADTSAVTVAGGATLDLNGNNETVGSLAGAGAVSLGAATLTAGGDGTSTAYSGAISGAGGFTKAGAGTLTVSGTNLYTGATTVTAGTLTVGLDDMFDHASDLTMNGGTFNLGSTFDEQFDLLNFATAAINFGAVSEAQYLMFSDDGSVTGTLAITNTSGVDKVGFTTNAISDSFLAGITLNGNSVRLSVGQVAFGGYGNFYELVEITTQTWDGGGGNVNWSTAANWDNADTAWTDGNIASIGSGFGSGTNVTLNGANVTAYKINMTGATSFNIVSNAGETLTIQAGGITKAAGAADVIISSNVIMAAAQTWNVDAGTLTVSGTVTNGGYTLTVDNDAAVAISGAVGGAGGITKLGSGTLTLSGGSGYTGATTITAGVIRVTNATGLGTTAGGVTVASGAALELSGGIVVGAEALSLDGTGVAAGGALRNITGNNSYAGDITLISAARINSDANMLTLSGAIGGAGMGLTVGGAGDTTISGVIGTAAGTLTKDGAGTLTLTNANTYTGLTTISVGAVNIQNATALGTTAAGTTVAAGASLQIQGSIAVGGEAITLNGTGGGNGALRNISGDNSITGTITLASASTIASDAGTLTLSTGGITGTFDLTVQGAGNTAISGVIGIDTGTLTKAGAGTLTLSGANTFTGITTLNAGTVSIAQDTNLGAAPGAVAATQITFNGGTLATTATFTLDSNRGITLAGNGTIDVASSTTLTYDGIMAGAGNFTKSGAGTLVLGGVNTFTGTTTISAGTLQVAADSAFGGDPGAPSAGDITINGGTLSVTTGFTLDSDRGIALGAGNGTITVANGQTLAYGGIMAGAGTLTKTGAGTLTLSGVNTYSGATTISGGTVSIAADSGLGTAPGGATAGHLTLDGGTLTTTAGFTLNAFRGIALGGSGGTINVSAGTLTYNGIAAGAGSLTKAGGGTLTLGGVNSYTGATIISAGTLQLGASGVIADASAVTVTGTLDLNGNDETVGSIAGSGTITSGVAGAVTLGAGGDGTSTTFSGVIQNGSGTVTLNKLGAGTLTLTGASNTYSGGTEIDAGTVSVASESALGTGGITFNGGTLAVTESLTLSKAMTLTGNGTLDVATGKAVEYSGIMGGAGDFNKSGTGDLTISGINTYTGSTTISGGTFIVTSAGSIDTSSGLTVATAATLRGTNTFTTPVTVSGLVHPGEGSGVGRLTFGSLELNGGQITLDLNGTDAGSYSDIKVNGTFTLTGSNKVNLNFGSGFMLQSGQSFQLVDSNAGAGAGTLEVGTTTNKPPALKMDLIKSGTNSVDIKVKGQAFSIAKNEMQDMSRTTAAMCSALDSLDRESALFDTDGNIERRNNALTKKMEPLSAKDLSEAIREVSPAKIAAVPALAFGSAKVQSGNVGGRFAELRGPTPGGFNSSNFAIDYKDSFKMLGVRQSIVATGDGWKDVAAWEPVVQRELSGMKYESDGWNTVGSWESGPSVGKPSAAANASEGWKDVTGWAPVDDVMRNHVDNPWGFFINGRGSFGGLKDKPNQTGYDFTTGGVTVGGDYRFTPGFAVGAYGGFTDSYTELQGTGGNIRLQGARVGVYTQYTQHNGYAPHGLYLNGMAGVGFNQYEISRNIRFVGLDEKAESSTHGMEFNTMVGGGYDFRFKLAQDESVVVTFGPTMAMFYDRTGVDSYRETGSIANLVVADNTYQSMRSQIGGKINYAVKVATFTFIPELTGAWQHEFEKNTQEVTARFAAGGNPFTVRSEDPGNNSVVVGGGCTQVWSQVFATYFKYDTELGLNDYHVHNINGGMNFRF